MLQAVPMLALAGMAATQLVRPGPALALAPGPRMPTAQEQAAIDAALKAAIPKNKAPVALRLAFHDAGTYLAATRDGGANASIQFELDRPENFGLKRGWRLVEQMRASLAGTPAEATVSDADLVALGGAYAVALCKGPRIPVRIGRAVAGGPDPEGRLPSEKASAAELKEQFAAKGFSAKEFLALSGAHTIGSKGFGDPYTFDTTYYVELLRKPWTNTQDAMASMIGLPTDHVLPDDPELAPLIAAYAADQPAFFADFAAAYTKMSELGAVWRAV